MFSGILMFVAIAFIYNLDKKTLNRMNEELAARKTATPAAVETVEEVVVEDEKDILTQFINRSDNTDEYKQQLVDEGLKLLNRVKNT